MQKFDRNNNFQPEAESIPDRLWDVVVIGAGPAGAMAAAHLAAGRYRVLLLDRKKFPREKVCGDGLLNNALSCLNTIGVIDSVQSTGRQLSSCSLFSPSQYEVQIPGKFLTLERSQLDKIVVQRAYDSGAFFARGAVDTLAVDPDGRVSLTIKKRDKRLTARIAILATGTNIRLTRPLKWPSEKRPSAVALRCYIQSTHSLDRMIVSCDRSIRPGYAWIFPMKDQLFNVGCGISLIHARKRGFNLKTTFNDFVDNFPLARQLMKESKMMTSLRWAALRHDFTGVYPWVKGPIIAAGETIGTTLPFLAEGVGKAMESGQKAAEAAGAALDSNDLGRLIQYTRYIESELRPRYRGYRAAENWLARPWLMDLLIYRSARSEYAKKILSGLISETIAPQELLSLKGIFKTLWK